MKFHKLFLVLAGISYSRVSFPAPELIGEFTLNSDSEFCGSYINRGEGDLFCRLVIEGEFISEAYSVRKKLKGSLRVPFLKGVVTRVCYDFSRYLIVRTPEGEIVENSLWKISHAQAEDYCS